MPVPAVEGVALAGGLCGLAHDAVGVGQALLEGLAGGELAAVSDVRHGMVVLLLVLGPLGEHGHVILAGNGLGEVDLVQVPLLVGEAGEVGDPVPAGEGVALAGGLCGLAHHAVGVGDALLEGLAGGELAAVSRVEDVDLVLLGVLGPLGVDVHVGLHGLGEVDLVGGLLLVGVAGVVSVPVPAVEGVALAGGRRSVNASVFVRLDRHAVAAISELSAICRKSKLSPGRLLGSSALAILIGVIGQCYCRHATKSKRQAQACCNSFLRTRILHLFSFSHCISPRRNASV